MDLRYADYKMRFEGVDVTDDNKELYVDPDRAIQCSCLLGFYCPNATTMYSCPDQEWCSEGTVDPFECDPLSMCSSSGGYYQVNFLNLLLALLTSIVILSISTFYIRRQLRKDTHSRGIDVVQEKQKLQESKKQKTSSTNLYSVVADDTREEAETSQAKVNHQSNQRRTNSAIEVKFRNIDLSFPEREQKVLDSVSGGIPPAKMTLLLGPSGRYDLKNYIYIAIKELH